MPLRHCADIIAIAAAITPLRFSLITPLSMPIIDYLPLYCFRHY
jgi:hypothetical protein